MTTTTEPGSSLTTRNAQITTAAVQIKTLTVSGKQVTLAVFRQLLRRQLVNAEGDLAGTPWGTVNYHSDRCGDDSPHHHVVWQNDSQLFRARMNRPVWSREEFMSPEVDAYLQAAYCVADHARRHDWTLYSHGIGFTFDGVSCLTDGTPEWPGRTYSGEDGNLHKHICRTPGELEQATPKLRGDLNDELARRRRINQQWRMICSLPQLFIAV